MTGSWHKGPGMKIGHGLLSHFLPTSSKTQPHWVGGSQGGEEQKKGLISLDCWSWLLVSPCWLYVLWRQTLWAGIFLCMAHVQFLVVCEHACGFLGGPCRDTHIQLPSICSNTSTSPLTPNPATHGLPTGSCGCNVLTEWAVLLAGMPASWLKHR